jgi:BolA protein
MSVEESIKGLIRQGLALYHLEVVNESGHHRGHAGDNGTGETHYNLLVVSDDFADMPRLQRQRVVNELLKGLLKQQVHALSMRCMSVGEYRKSIGNP